MNKTKNNMNYDLTPGNYHCKINKVELIEDEKYKGAYSILLHLETEAKVDNGNTHLSTKKGIVKATRFPFADGVTWDDVKISKDKEILKWLYCFCTFNKCFDWFQSQDERHTTIESFFLAFIYDKPFKNKYYRFCIAGEEIEDENGSLTYNLFLPKMSNEERPFESLDTEMTNLTIFDKNEHIIKIK